MAQGCAHILLADDEAHVLHVLCRALELEGHRLTACSDGREALEAARRDRPDLIITDVRMPAMTGLELAAALRESQDTAGIPLILLTARGNDLDRAALAGTNIREVCPKPFSARAIVSRAEAILAERDGASRP